jgi:hypothetical protein
MGFFAYKALNKPLISPNNKISRYRICQGWLMMPNNYWDQVIFSDECKFNLITSDGVNYIWREKGKRLDSKYLTTTVKHEREKIVAWGCISSSGVGRMVFIREIMDKHLYLSILANNLLQSAKDMGLDEFIFQQDNDPKHTSMLVTRFLEEKGIEKLEWLSQSPDLNSIEHVWAKMKYNLEGKMFRNEKELEMELRRMWENMDREFLKKIISSMPRRIIDVVKAKGGHTSY